MKYLNMTVPHDQFTIDGQPSKVTSRVFCGEEKTPPAQREDGVILDEIIFRDPNSRMESYESSVSIELFGFNGTTVLTPSAVNLTSSLGIHEIDDEQLEGRLLVIPCTQLFALNQEDLIKSLHSVGVVNANGVKITDEKYIVLFKTGLMDRVLEYVDEKGVPKEGFGRTQESRPGMGTGGARYLAELDIAKAYAIDNISFEHHCQEPGFVATQLLMNPNEDAGTFVPLVYHVIGTTTRGFEALQDKKPYVRIELGNIPGYRPLDGHPVAFKMQMR